jgi:hypothetical protein
MAEQFPISVSVEYRAPVFLRGLALFALVVTPLFALIAFLAWWLEGALIGLWTLPLWLSMAGYWWWQWRQWAQHFRLYPDRLTVLTPGRSLFTLPYSDLQAVRLARGRLHLTTQHETYTLHGDPNTMASLAAALLTRAPALDPTRDALTLPIRVDAPRQPVILLNIFGLLIGAMGVGLGHAAISDVEFPNRVMALLFAGVMVGMAGFALYWLLVTFVWHYTFEQAVISVHHSLRTVRYDPAHLRQITLTAQDVIHRGFTKTLYALQLSFAQGEPLIVQPAAQNYPFEYADAHEQVMLTQLLTQLETLYAMHLIPTRPPVTTRWLDPKTDWHPQPGLAKPPDLIIEHHSHSADLRVTILNYGERQPGAEDVQLHLSRPLAGQQIFDTTNGDATFSASGAYLLLATPFLLIAIDAHIMQAWHYALPDRTMLYNAGWEGERLVGKLIPYGKRADAAITIGPYTWAEVTDQWQPGLGRAAAFTPRSQER